MAVRLTAIANAEYEALCQTIMTEALDGERWAEELLVRHVFARHDDGQDALRASDRVGCTAAFGTDGFRGHQLTNQPSLAYSRRDPTGIFSALDALRPGRTLLSSESPIA